MFEIVWLTLKLTLTLVRLVGEGEGGLVELVGLVLGLEEGTELLGIEDEGFDVEGLLEDGMQVGLELLG